MIHKCKYCGKRIRNPKESMRNHFRRTHIKRKTRDELEREKFILFLLGLEDAPH